MIIGYLLFAILAGSFAGVFTYIHASSLLLAFGAYTLAGTATLVILPLLNIALGGASDQPDGQPTLTPSSQGGVGDLVKASMERL